MLPGLPDTHVLYYNKCNPSYSPQKSMLLSLDSRFLWSSFYEKQTQTSQRSAGPARWIWEFIGHHPPKKLPQRSHNDVCLFQSSNEIYCQTMCKTILNTIFNSARPLPYACHLYKKPPPCLRQIHFHLCRGPWGPVFGRWDRNCNRFEPSCWGHPRVGGWKICARQIGSFPQGFRVRIKNSWNHHL